MNKKELSDKIKNLDGLTKDEKSELLKLVNSKKKYGLVWEDKPEEVEEQLRTHLPVLKEVKERAILNSPPSGEPEGAFPNHILIEGDNLHALTTLTFTHEGKIDLIYIDPPYNTGNKDFVYNDSFVDKEDAFRHSKWLSFMSKRLKIAKQLLAEDGLILMSIDDYEVAQLKLLGNEIFGEKNFVGQWNWYKSATPPNLSHKIRKNLEYVLGYEKSRTNIKYKGAQKTSSSDDPLTKPQNTIKELIFPSGSINFKVKNAEIKPGTYGTTKYPNILKNKLVIENSKNKNEVIFENRFVWTQPKLEEELKSKTRINGSKNLVLSYKKTNYDEEVPLNLIDESVGVNTTEEAGKQLFNIFGKKVFDYPKPVSLIKYIIRFKKSNTILDFFAGSGTSLQAIVEANKEDNSSRQGILVTNNENNIAEEITYERNKRIIQGYTDSKGNKIEGLKNNNLRYYKTEFVERKTSLANKRKLTLLANELLCIKEDCYTEVTSKLQENAWHKFFTNGKNNYVYVVYDDMQLGEAVELLAAFIAENKEAQIKVYVFANGSYPYTEEFEEIAENVELAALPDAIYKAYQNILPKQNKDFVPELEEETSSEGEKEVELPLEFEQQKNDI